MSRLAWRVGVAVTLLAATAVPQKLEARDVIRPAFELRIERQDLFTKSQFAPLFEAMVDEFSDAMGLEDEAKRGVIERHWASIAWPLTVQIYPAADGTPMLALWSPAEGPALLPTLIAVHDQDLRDQRTGIIRSGRESNVAAPRSPASFASHWEKQTQGIPPSEQLNGNGFNPTAKQSRFARAKSLCNSRPPTPASSSIST